MSELCIDKATILDRLGGDEELFVEMANMFVGEIGTYCEDLQAALASEDAVRLQREAHTIKGLMATFADDPGVEMALAVEQRARAGEVVELASAVRQLETRVRLLADVLQREYGA